MRSPAIPFWKKAPFARLILPVIAGILLQWYIQPELQQGLVSAFCFMVAYISFRLLPLSFRFKLMAVQGVFINLLLAVLGSYITLQKDIRNHPNWMGKVYQDSDYLVATINEPLVEKNRSFKAEAVIDNIIHGDSVRYTSGRIIIYFEKDSAHPLSLQYGDKILFNKKFQQIKNSGNPGAFDYRQYSAFHQLFHTVFLKKKDWALLNEKNAGPFRQFLFTAKQRVLNILRKNLQANDDQLAIAEALLIGYTQDLDKDLVQAYSNTGVVHIIAISGMHLGLIYILLVWLLNKIPLIKRSSIIKVILILSCLWIFSLITGGSPSILRAAVMFSCITIGRNLNRTASIYNSLAASAFILLCYNPYFLWDVGFQLSYLAVAGIVIFQKPVYRMLYIKNRVLDNTWKLTTVSFAAQLLTFPVCLFYFHQFPTLFLFTNILLVPFSSLVLFVEIFLMAIAWLPIAAAYVGKLTWWLVWMMNKTILWFNDLPYSVWDGVSIPVPAVFILYGVILTAGYWLLNKNKTAFKISLWMFLSFTALSVYTKWKTSSQQKIIVYNIPRHRSIDFINGNTYKFIGDTSVTGNNMLQHFHMKPARIALQLSREVDSIPILDSRGDVYFFKDKKILLIHTPIVFHPAAVKINVDYIIISNNPGLSIPQLATVFNCNQFIFDGSNSLWKIAKWKKECEQLHLRCYSVPEQGAFVLDL